MSGDVCYQCNGQLAPADVDCPWCGAEVFNPAPVERPAGGYDGRTVDAGTGAWTGTTFGPPTAPVSAPATVWVDGVPPAQIAHLIVKRGVPEGRAFRLGELNTVGRDSRASSIVLGHDESVSREHARIRLEDGSFVYYNLSGSYGSYLLRPNGRRRIDGRLVLRDGDEIEVGERTVLSFRQSSGSADRGRHGHSSR